MTAEIELLIKELLAQTEALLHRDQIALDKLLQRVEMVVRKRFGSSSVYLTKLADIRFDPACIYTGMSDTKNDEVWHDGKARLTNLLNTMLEDLRIPISNHASPRTEKTIAESSQQHKDYVASTIKWAKSKPVIAGVIVVVTVLAVLIPIILGFKEMFSSNPLEQHNNNQQMTVNINTPSTLPPSDPPMMEQPNVIQQVTVIVPAAPSEPILTPMATKLLGIIYRYQVETGLNKIAIDRDHGEVYYNDTAIRDKYHFNAMTDLFGSSADTTARKQEFEYILDSIPSAYLARIPEALYENPYVVQVTPDGTRYCMKARGGQ